MFNENQFPEWFATGRTILLFKSGNSNEPKNYSPITLLNTTYKLFTTILEKRITKSITETGLWDANQQALVPTKKGCLDAHLSSEALTVYFRNIGQTECTSSYIDFKKAYDSVDHHAMREMVQRVLPRKRSAT